jgi:hypothetical protein
MMMREEGEEGKREGKLGWETEAWRGMAICTEKERSASAMISDLSL